MSDEQPKAKPKPAVWRAHVSMRSLLAVLIWFVSSTLISIGISIGGGLVIIAAAVLVCSIVLVCGVCAVVAVVGACFAVVFIFPGWCMTAQPIKQAVQEVRKAQKQ